MQIAVACVHSEVSRLLQLLFDVTITQKNQKHQGDRQYLENPPPP